MTDTTKAINALAWVLLAAACIWMALSEPDAVETKTQADYEWAACVGSELPECKSYQVAGNGK